MKLVIKFHGLCCFVEKDAQVRVLMPASGGSMKHTAALTYDGRFDVPQSSGRLLPLEGRELVFRGLPGNGASIVWGNGLEDITQLTAAKIDTDCLKGNSAKKVGARVLLTDGTVKGAGEQACWSFQDASGAEIGHRAMTDLVTCTIELTTESVEWGVRPLGTEKDPEKWVEVSTKGGDPIVLDIYHVSEDVTDPHPSGGVWETPHFHMYYHLLNGNSAVKKVVYFADDACPAVGPLIPGEPARSPSLYSCMVTGGAL